LKSENEEEASHRCTTSDGHPINLRRKPSNRQQQQSEGGVSSIYSNIHVPSASRQFTLASPSDGDAVSSVAIAAASAAVGTSDLVHGIAGTSTAMGTTSANLPSNNDDELLEVPALI
uniref:CG11172 n=1 Tax=Taenia asiatica TaxID=60517 RepID=A0A0R3VZ62_TAEAS